MIPKSIDYTETEMSLVANIIRQKRFQKKQRGFNQSIDTSYLPDV